VGRSSRLINPVEDHTLLNPNDDFIINHRGVKWLLFRSQIDRWKVLAHIIFL
jgi:hemin uptake protein HemP